MTDIFQISAVIDSIGETPITLQVIEFHPYEPPAYVFCAGWTCSYGDDEYFVDECGIVYADDPEKPHENMSKQVGYAPEIQAACDRMEKEIDNAFNEARKDTI